MSHRTPKSNKKQSNTDSPLEVKWLPHKHCQVCGGPMNPDKIACSTECEELLGEYRQKAKRRNQLYFIVLLPATIILVVWILLQI
ncbi:MAG: DUF2116 family Zn-ribbon domain-containing protein [Candidatus Ranarchaeia archaeon]